MLYLEDYGILQADEREMNLSLPHTFVAVTARNWDLVSVSGDAGVESFPEVRTFFPSGKAPVSIYLFREGDKVKLRFGSNLCLLSFTRNWSGEGPRFKYSFV